MTKLMVAFSNFANVPKNGICDYLFYEDGQITS
jgi:mRNA deadenylase 3'-5' endonuclease subunit Ccr4